MIVISTIKDDDDDDDDEVVVPVMEVETELGQS